MTTIKQDKKLSSNYAWIELYELASKCIRIDEGIIDFDTFVESGKDIFELKIKPDKNEGKSTI